MTEQTFVAVLFLSASLPLSVSLSPKCCFSLLSPGSQCGERFSVVEEYEEVQISASAKYNKGN